MVNSYSDWSPCVSSVFFLSNSPAGFSIQPSLAYCFFSPDVLSNGGGSHHNKHTGRPSFKTCLLTVIWPQNYDDHYCNFQTLWISLASKPSKPYRCRRSRQWYIYIGFRTFFYAVRHLDSTISYLPTGLHVGFFHSQPSLFLPSNFSSGFRLPSDSAIKQINYLLIRNSMNINFLSIGLNWRL